MRNESVGKVPWSFWVVGTVALVWNLPGCMNFIAQMDPDAVATLPEPYRVAIEARPAWATVAFAIAVFGGALGSLLLLLRKSSACYLFAASLVGAIVAVAQWHAASGFEPTGALLGGAAQVMVAALLVLYAQRAQRMGWLTWL